MLAQRPSRMRGTVRFSLTLILFSATASLGACPSTKTQFTEMSYPDSLSKRPKPDATLSMLASLSPTLQVAYEDAYAVGQCLDSFVALDQTAVPRGPDCLELLWEAGRCINGDDTPWRRCAREARCWLGNAQVAAAAKNCSALAQSCRLSARPACAKLGVWDRLRLARSLLDTGEALFAKHLARGGAPDAAIDEHRGATRAVVKNAALILRHESNALQKAAPPYRPRVEQPALALSGGAANGAFTAGYLHAMLSLRETAITQCGGQPGSKDKNLAQLAETEYRFSGAAGTSVGSLISMLVDLYFARGDKLTPDQAGAVRRCLADARRGGVGDGHVPAKRALQACALAKLRRELSTRNEWDLLCVEPGTIFDLLGSRPNMLRFTPLIEQIVRPYLRDFGALLHANDFITVFMGVDLQQSVLVGVDERVCQADAATTVDCLASGIQASISEPVFVPPVRRIFLGLRPGGQPGAWLDGGLHSGTPVTRALGLTGDGAPVLAINTHRAEGVPSARPKDAFDALFGSLGTMADRTREWEIGYGQLFDEERQRKLLLLFRLLEGRKDSPPTRRWQSRQRWAQSAQQPPAATTQPAKPKAAKRRYFRLGGKVSSVYVPADIEPVDLFASGYTFHPLVMRGLFLYGQQTFLRRRRDTFRWLGWKRLGELEGQKCGAQPCCDAYDKSISQLEAAVDTELRDRFVPLQGKRLLSIRAARRKQMEANMRTCY